MWVGLGPQSSQVLRPQSHLNLILKTGVVFNKATRADISASTFGGEIGHMTNTPITVMPHYLLMGSLAIGFQVVYLTFLVAKL